MHTPEILREELQLQMVPLPHPVKEQLIMERHVQYPQPGDISVLEV